jgi:hypothetical protein
MAFKKTVKRKKGERYNHTKVEADGLKFDSKKEYERYLFLKSEVESGNISNLRTQVTYELIPAVTEEYVEHPKTKDKIKTRTLQRPITWTADFVYNKGNEEIVEDVKPSKFLLSDRFVIKEKLFFWRYRKKIRLIYDVKDPI